MFRNQTYSQSYSKSILWAELNRKRYSNNQKNGIGIKADIDYEKLLTKR